jgi:hypothetical protein
MGTSVTMLVELVAGIALLVLGRRLFWLFVAGAGFVTGLVLAPRLFPEGSQAIVLIVAVGLGIVGALLTLLFQRVAIAVAGFLIGGYLAMALGDNLQLLPQSLPGWFFFLIGGIIGAVLVAALFDWALIILSSITGAALVIDALQASPHVFAPAGADAGLADNGALLMVVFVVLLAAGLIIQSRAMRA